MDPSPGIRPRTLLVPFGILAVLAASLLGGCRHNNAINFATSTQFGVKVGVNAEKIPEVQVGYNRQEAARVPVYLEQDKNTAGPATTPGNASVHALLRQAQILLQSTDANVQAKGAKLIVGLQQGAGRSLGTNLVYQLAFAEAAKSLNTSGPQPDPLLLNACIQAALDLPVETQRFHEQGKFIATRQGDNAADAYSVLGTFSGDGAGSLSTNSGRLKIAQFFATGVAAQELARYGGAATVNPNANSPATLSLDERIKERKIGRAQQQASDGLTQLATHLANISDPARRAAEVGRMMAGLTLADGDSVDDRKKAIAPPADAARIRQELDTYSRPEEVLLMKKNVGLQ